MAMIQLNRKKIIARKIPRMIRTAVFLTAPRQPNPPTKLHSAQTTNTIGPNPEGYFSFDVTVTSKMGIGAKPTTSQIKAAIGWDCV